MSPLRALARDERGGIVTEFALVANTVILLLVGMLQVGALMYANTTMRSALGEGARFAGLYRAPSGSAWAGPSAADICTRVKSQIGSMNNATIDDPATAGSATDGLTLTRTANGTANAIRLSMIYRVNMNWLVLPIVPTSNLTASRTVYVRTQPNFTTHTCA